jgi:hypothetical protein
LVRAAELFSAISESRVLGSDGKPKVIKTELTAGQATTFYQGTLHYQMNPEGELASALAAFLHEDASVFGIAPALISAHTNALAHTFVEAIDGEDIDKSRGAIPVAVSIKVEECPGKCGKQKRRA